MRSQAEKGRAFRALHEREGAFIIPNPWDAGTARLLAHLGFEALATTSAGYAFSVGQRDNTVGRDKMMSHVSAIVSATDLPVSADLGGIAGGGLSSYFIARGTPPVKARPVAMLLSALCLSPIVFAARAGRLWTAVAAIPIALGPLQSWITNMFGLLADVTPRSVLASVLGFGSMVASVGGRTGANCS